jgi:uncharacterized protein
MNPFAPTRNTEPGPIEKPPLVPRRDPAPTRRQERVVVVDVLRGFAVFGILVANMASFSGLPPGYHAWTQPIDQTIYLLTRFFVEAKFYSLFSFLFGWGMAVFLARAAMKGDRFTARYSLRLLLLLFIGLLHGIFIWNGDILTLYALLGLLLILFKDRSPRFLTITAIAALMFSIVLTLPLQPFSGFQEWYVNLTSGLRSRPDPEELYRAGTYLEIVRARIHNFIPALMLSLFSVGNVFAMFLLGLAAGKTDLIGRLTRDASLQRKWIKPAVMAGLIFNACYVSTIVWHERLPADWVRTLAVGSRTIGAPALMLSYVVILIVLFQHERWRKYLTGLSSVGQSALSNYLLQSILCTLIFYGYGLGLYGEFDPTAALFLTILLFLIQVRLSEWWMERYRFGPAEWVWRTFTYQYLQPMRRHWHFERQILPEKGESDRVRANRLFFSVCWIVLALWMTGLIAWNLTRAGKRFNPEALAASLQVRSTHGSAGTMSEGGDTSPTSIPRPSPHAVIRNPDAGAASGDLLGLSNRFDVDRALAQVEALSSSAFDGRLSASAGGWAAGDYIARQFSSLGLQPFGEEGGYFQAFPVPYAPLEGTPRLSVVPSPGSAPIEFMLHRDFSPRAGEYVGEGLFEGDVVWASDCRESDFDEIIAAERIVLCRYDREVPSARNAIEHGAGGLILIDLSGRPLDFAFPSRESIVPEPIPSAFVSMQVVEALVRDSTISAEDLIISYESLYLESSVGMEVGIADPGQCAEERCLGRNVIGILPGRDPDRSNQFVILSAHYDHMGNSPAGIFWPGANDDASGIAAMLEIARVWKESGFVPHKSVVFAAWDAEELGLLGARYFVEHPPASLDNISAVIQLDMIGGGGSVLRIDGWRGLENLIKPAADLFEVESVITDSGQSDHVPFLDIGLPAALLIWYDPSGEYADYHRLQDTPERIDRTALDLAGKIAHLALLNLVEGEALIEDLLDERARAIEDGDKSGFLSTSIPTRVSEDGRWFDDAVLLAPTSALLEVNELSFHGRYAVGSVHVRLNYLDPQDPAQEKLLSGTVPVRFEHTSSGWRWSGVDLAPFDLSPPDGAEQAEQPVTSLPMRVDVALPAGSESDPRAEILDAVERMQTASELLAMPIPERLTIEFYEDGQDLAIDTSPLLGQAHSRWISGDAVRLTLAELSSNPAALEEALIQSLLVHAGLEKEAAGLFWDGLPLAIRVQEDPALLQSDLLIDLNPEFAAPPAASPAAEWAAVDFLRSEIGWQGIGRILVSAGSRCRNRACETGRVLDQTLQASSVYLERSLMEASSATWQHRLQQAQSGVAQVVQAQLDALTRGDEDAFLQTIDPGIPGLIADERVVFQRLVEQEVELALSTVRPLAILDSGYVYAQFAFEEASGLEPPTTPGRIELYGWFTPQGSGFRFAGWSISQASGFHARVRHSSAGAALAPDVAALIDEILLGLSQEIDLPAGTIQVTLFTDPNQYRHAIGFLAATPPLPRFWNDKEGTLKLLIEPDDDIESDNSFIIEGVIRHILAESGIEDEWLLRGLSLYLSPALDNRSREQRAMRNLGKLPGAVRYERIHPLTAIPRDEDLDDDARRIAEAQTWDAVNHLVETYGIERIRQLLRFTQRDIEPYQAFTSLYGFSADAYAETWEESMLAGHIRSEMESVIQLTDEDALMETLSRLASDPYDSRQPGSPGSASTAAFIAEKYEEFGLAAPTDAIRPSDAAAGEPVEPADVPPSAAPSPTGASSYFQRFPVYYQTYLQSPSLQITSSQGTGSANLLYRKDFIDLPQGYRYDGPVKGPIILSSGEIPTYLDLSGKVVLRELERALQVEIETLVERNPAGLILAVGDDLPNTFDIKIPRPVSEPTGYGIPVFLITRQAYQAILDREMASQDPGTFLHPVTQTALEAILDLPLQDPELTTEVNVLGLLPGSDPDLAREVILLGAHFDNTGQDPDVWICPPGEAPPSGLAHAGSCQVEEGQRFPDSSDSGSGVAALLEIARVLSDAAYRPKRSILFAAWGAQEPGEIGSRYFVEDPPFLLDNLVAVVQMDHLGSGSGYYLEAFGSFQQDGLPASRMLQIQAPAESRVRMEQDSLENLTGDCEERVSWGSWRTRSQPLCSDHSPFQKIGIPSLLVRWRGANLENLPAEEENAVRPENLSSAARMLALLVMSLAQ